VKQGKLPHQVSIETERTAFNRLFIEDTAPSIAELGKVKGNKTDVSHFDKALDFTFYPIRMAVQ